MEEHGEIIIDGHSLKLGMLVDIAKLEIETSLLLLIRLNEALCDCFGMCSQPLALQAEFPRLRIGYEIR